MLLLLPRKFSNSSRTVITSSSDNFSIMTCLSNEHTFQEIIKNKIDTSKIVLKLNNTPGPHSSTENLLSYKSALYIKQQMPSRQQLSAEKGFERYLMFGPNHILVTLSWVDRGSPGHENVSRWFLIDTKKYWVRQN